MREKLRLSDLNVLFVCMDMGHGTNCHRVLADVTTFHNLGGNPLLVCRKGSVLDTLAEQQDVRRHYLDVRGGWRSAVELFQFVRQLVKTEQLDLVHCYNYKPTLVLGFALKREARIPLVYTSNEDVGDLYLPFWHDYFITRVDQVLCFSAALGDRTMDILPLGGRQVGFTGAGLEHPHHPAAAPTGDVWKLCAYVRPDEDDIERFAPLFMALPLLELTGKRVVLSLATEGSWYQHPFYEKFKHAVLERGLEHHISFHPRSWGAETLTGHHLFVALETDVPFEDHELQALLHQVPALLPRTSARTHLLQGGTLGLTYKAGDVRELRARALEILENHTKFHAALGTALPDLTEKHHFDRYAGELLQLYERLSLQRLRFSLKRSGPFASRT